MDPPSIFSHVFGGIDGNYEERMERNASRIKEVVKKLRERGFKVRYHDGNYTCKVELDGVYELSVSYPLTSGILETYLFKDGTFCNEKGYQDGPKEMVTVESVIEEIKRLET